MEAINAVLERMERNGDSAAVFYGGREYSYVEFFRLIRQWDERLERMGIVSGSVCAFLGEFSLQMGALTFALMIRRAVLVPYSPVVENEIRDFNVICGVEHLIRFDEKDEWTHERFVVAEKNPLIESFLERDVPGLVVFTSGSTGKPKGILHDCDRVMRKFVEMKKGWRALLFLMPDHFGGFNTFLSTFAYSGCAVCLPDRTPEKVCQVIEDSRATLLPTTPTFINFLITSRCYLDYDLSSIQLITYGTEVMPEATLEKLRTIFPNTKFKQTYGLSELGVLRSKSRSDDSLWVKIGGSGFETKVRDNILWVRSEANMVGYLNAPNPIDDEGWMCTGDHVEVDGDYMRILGRKSDMINVGGYKVFPAEVETVILKAGNIKEASVFSKKHPIMGSMIMAKVSLIEPEEREPLNERLRKHCLENMARYKVPIKFKIVSDKEQVSGRFKKIRK